MSTHFKLKKSPQEAVFTVLRQISYTKLFKKYTSGNFSYNKISINRLLFSDNCLIVARFKDYLILDDQTEFIRRFYPTKDLNQKLNKILAFYEKYSKIFPNYLILKENRYLYRNIRRKQKIIDAFNEIKREEKENRKKLKIDESDKNNNNELFTKKIKNEIKTFQNNVSFKNYRNSFDSDKINEDTLLINQNSIYYRQLKDGDKSNKKFDSFIDNQTNGSISYLVNVLNDNKIYTKDLPNILIQNNSNNNNNKNIIKKNKKTKYGIEMKNKINKKIQKIKESNQNSINIINNINNISNKDENEFQSSKDIKNNSIIKKKKIIDKNSLYKGAFTSTNVTNSSSFVLKKNKNPQISSSININNKDNIENKNIQNNNDNKYHNNNSASKNIQNNKDKDVNKYYINNDNSNKIIIKNLYQKTSSDFSKYESKKNFSKINNNFKKAILNDNKNIKDNENENTQKNRDDNNKKEKYKINKEIVKKKYIRCKYISQDFDSNQIYKMTENILSKNNNTPNENSNNIINTENIYFRPYKNYIINDNPNLITGDTKSNERNEKNFMEDKDIMNIRDLIAQEKEDKKIYYTAKKITKNSLLNLTKTNSNSQNMTKSLKLNKSKNNNSNTIDNNNYKKDIIYNSNGKNNKTLRNNSAITKQKTELKFGNKKFLSKIDKTKTKQIFINNLIKSSENKKLFLKTSENFNMPKKIFAKSKDKEIKEKTIDLYNINRNKKFYDKRIESTYIPLNYQKKMNYERIIIPNLSDINMKKKDIFLKSSKKRNKKYKTKNHIAKSSNKTNINTSSKLASSGSEKDYRSYLKNNNNIEFNYSSQKNLLSINILNRIQAIKQNKTKNDFYRNLKLKNSTKSFHANNSSKSKSISEIKSKKTKTYKTPIMNNKKTNCYKKHISKRLDKVNLEKTKDEMMNIYMSSFSIKVNKTAYNKENNKSKNLKKMWSKKITNIVNQINNNRRNELKQ